MIQGADQQESVGREFLALRNVFKAAISPSFSPFQNNPQKQSIVF